jgi:hypothetical protein
MQQMVCERRGTLLSYANVLLKDATNVRKLEAGVERFVGQRVNSCRPKSI